MRELLDLMTLLSEHEACRPEANKQPKEPGGPRRRPPMGWAQSARENECRMAPWSRAVLRYSTIALLRSRERGKEEHSGTLLRNENADCSAFVLQQISMGRRAYYRN